MAHPRTPKLQRFTILLTALLGCDCGRCFPADETEGHAKLRPGAVLQFTFPELPATLYARTTGEKTTPLLTARLPDNYAPEGHWPLFVFLGGGAGGKGSSADGAAQLTGRRDFIAVSLPLFKRTFDPAEPFGGLLITLDDFEVVRSAYRTMLERLLHEVPGIVPERSTLGGSSNGAHTTALLVAGHDEFIFAHFRQFFFVDGGAPFLAAFAMLQPATQKFRFLMLRADQPILMTPRPGRPAYDVRVFMDHLNDAVDMRARAFGLDWTQVVMKGKPHGFHDEYKPLVGQWARGEPLAEVAPMPIQPNTPKQ